jgi:hypothetical protein
MRAFRQSAVLSAVALVPYLRRNILAFLQAGHLFPRAIWLAPICHSREQDRQMVPRVMTISDCTLDLPLQLAPKGSASNRSNPQLEEGVRLEDTSCKLGSSRPVTEIGCFAGFPPAFQPNHVSRTDPPGFGLGLVLIRRPKSPHFSLSCNDKC